MKVSNKHHVRAPLTLANGSPYFSYVGCSGSRGELQKFLLCNKLKDDSRLVQFVAYLQHLLSYPGSS